MKSIICEECKKTFCKLVSLRSHVKRSHPDKLDILAPYVRKKSDSSTSTCSKCNQTLKCSNLSYHMKTKHFDKADTLVPAVKKEKRYLCETCGKEFNILNRFLNHKNTHKHHRVFKELKCNLCYQYSHRSKENLLKHFKEFHGIQIENETHTFSSFEKFSLWKRKIEEETNASFVKMHGSHKTKLYTKIKYSCHRSGEFRKRGKNQRRLKCQGSNKIDAYCPASINVIIKQDGFCEAQHLKTHIGHDKEVNHLFLNEFQRKEIANKIAANVPFKEILDEIHESKLERLRVLKKKDLHNIKQCLRVNCDTLTSNDENRNEELDCNGDDNDDDEVPSNNSPVKIDPKLEEFSYEESVTVAQAKSLNQTLIDAKVKVMEDFVKIMNSITSIEELEIVKNNIAPIGPALSVLNMNDTTSDNQHLSSTSNIQNSKDTSKGPLFATREAVEKNNLNESPELSDTKLHTRFEFYFNA